MTARESTASRPFEGAGFIALMAIICSLSPFAMSLLVPAFPGLANEFSVDVAELQWLITAFLIGLGVAQPVHGALADRFGRRPVLLIGFFIFTLASLASLFVGDFFWLVLWRFVQAIGVSAGTVTSRTIINDVQDRERAAITLAYVSVAMGVGPIIAPVISGPLDLAFGWQSLYLLCVISGAVILFLAIVRLPETRPEMKTQSFSEVLSNYWYCLKNPAFLGFTAMFGFGQGIFFAFLPIAPDYFEIVLDYPRSVFIGSWVILSLAFMTGSFAGTRLTKKWGLDATLYRASLFLLVISAIWGAAFIVFGGNIYALIIPFILATFCTGLICPLALAGSISLFHKRAGTAAGLSSSLGLVLGGSFSLFSGLLYIGTLWPFYSLACVAILGNLLAVMLTKRNVT